MTEIGCEGNPFHFQQQQQHHQDDLFGRLKEIKYKTIRKQINNVDNIIHVHIIIKNESKQQTSLPVNRVFLYNF